MKRTSAARSTIKHRMTSLLAAAGVFVSSLGLADTAGSLAPGQPGKPYPDMPSIAPIGERIDKYYDLPEIAKGVPVDPARGYRIEELGKGLYLICDGA